MMTRRDFFISTAALAAGCRTSGGGKAGQPASQFNNNHSVFLSDVHVSPSVSPDDSYQLASFRRCIDEILAMRPLPARAVVFGDIALGKGMTADYETSRPEFLRLVEAGIKVHYTMGNHDHREPFLRVFPEAAADMHVKGRFASVVSLGAWYDLLLLDSLDEIGKGEGEPTVGTGTIDEAQLNWLEDVVSRAKRPFICGAHHSPRELSFVSNGQRRGVLQKLKESELYMGWVQGHGHCWAKSFNACSSTNPLATFRLLCLPSTGYWGDIGYANVYSHPDGIVITPRIWDFYYPRPARDGEVRPKCWDDIVMEKGNDVCKFASPIDYSNVPLSW